MYDYSYYVERAWEERLITLCQTPCVCLKPFKTFEVVMRFTADERCYAN